MHRRHSTIFVLVPMLAILMFQPATDKIRVFLAGDSTIAIKAQKAWPETGWGMPFAQFWDSSVEVRNKAMNGRSTKTFILEGRWQNILDEMRAG